MSNQVENMSTITHVVNCIHHIYIGEKFMRLVENSGNKTYIDLFSADTIIIKRRQLDQLNLVVIQHQSSRHRPSSIEITYASPQSLIIDHTYSTIVELRECVITQAWIRCRNLYVRSSRIDIHARVIGLVSIVSSAITGNIIGTKIYADEVSKLSAHGYALATSSDRKRYDHIQIFNCNDSRFRYIRGRYTIPRGKYIIHIICSYAVIWLVGQTRKQFGDEMRSKLEYHRRIIH